MDDHSHATKGYQTFSYKKPDNLRKGKGIVQLAQSQLIRGRVQRGGSGKLNRLVKWTFRATAA